MVFYYFSTLVLFQVLRRTPNFLIDDSHNKLVNCFHHTINQQQNKHSKIPFATNQNEDGILIKAYHSLVLKTKLIEKGTKKTGVTTLLSGAKTEERMFAVFQEWKAATDPMEKRFLYSMLENMRLDLDASKALVGGLDAGSDTPGGDGEDGGGEDGDGDDEE